VGFAALAVMLEKKAKEEIPQGDAAWRRGLHAGAGALRASSITLGISSFAFFSSITASAANPTERIGKRSKGTSSVEK